SETRSAVRSFSSSLDEETLEAFLDGPAKEKKCVVGIDFGTTNSGFAYAMTSNRKIVVLKEKEPTCALFKRENHKLVKFGLEARDFYRKAQAGQELLTKFSAQRQTNWEDKYVYLDQNIKMELFEEHRSGEDMEEQRKAEQDVEESEPDDNWFSYFNVVAAILERMKSEALHKIQLDTKQRI
ncbi:Heat shock 70 kDa protein 12A, partial [Durusdinium trenchii]